MFVTDSLPYTKVVHAVVMVGIILGVLAGKESTDPSDTNQVSTFRIISALLFSAVFFFSVGLHGYFWVNRYALQSARRAVSVYINTFGSQVS